MKFLEQLYIGEHIEAEQERILSNLQHARFSPTIFVLILCEGQLEIVYNYLLFLTPYTKKEYTVVGLARGKLEAFRLVERIYKEALAACMEMNVIGYLDAKADVGSLHTDGKEMP